MNKVKLCLKKIPFIYTLFFDVPTFALPSNLTFCPQKLPNLGEKSSKMIQ